MSTWPSDQVHLTDGTALGYDVLVIATGARLLPEETEGLTGPGWMKDVFTFYTLPGARGPADGAGPVRRRPAGRQRHRHADQVPGRAAGILLPRRLVLPAGAGSLPRPAQLRHAPGRRIHQASLQPGTVRAARQPGHRAGHRVQHRHGAGRNRGVPACVLRRPRGAVRPGRDGPAARRSRLCRPLSWPRRRTRLHSRDPRTLQATAKPNIFAIGDATDVPASKAGSVAHFEGETLTDTVRAYLAGPAGHRRLRRPHQLLHRDRRRQGAAHRLQLRHRTAHRPLPRQARPAAAPANRA